MAEQKTENTQQFVYNSLRTSILNLNLVPGTVISENDISLRFKVSRTPVREAFSTLSREALVTVMPQKRSMVSLIDFSRIKQEFFLRENLEPAALKLFIKNHNASHLEELEKIIETQAEAVSTRRVEPFLQYDNLFHRVFFYGQKVASEAMEKMCGHYNRVRLLSLWLQDIVENVVEEHKQLFQAIKQKDEVKALALLGSHIRKLDSEEPLLRRMFPDYFTNPGEDTFAADFSNLKKN